MKNTHEILKIARVYLGLSEKEVCQMTGLSISEYGDLELYPDEFFDTISIAQARKICEILKLDLISLIPRDSSLNFINTSAQSKADLVSKSRGILGLSASQLADKIGYETTTIEEVETDEKNIEALNISAILEIAKVLRIEPAKLII